MEPEPLRCKYEEHHDPYTGEHLGLCEIYGHTWGLDGACTICDYEPNWFEVSS